MKSLKQWRIELVRVYQLFGRPSDVLHIEYKLMEKKPSIVVGIVKQLAKCADDSSAAL